MKKIYYIVTKNGEVVKTFEPKEKYDALKLKTFMDMTHHCDPKTGVVNLHQVFRRVETEVRQ